MYIYKMSVATTPTILPKKGMYCFPDMPLSAHKPQTMPAMNGPIALASAFKVWLAPFTEPICFMGATVLIMIVELERAIILAMLRTAIPTNMQAWVAHGICTNVCAKGSMREEGIDNKSPILQHFL